MLHKVLLHSAVSISIVTKRCTNATATALTFHAITKGFSLRRTFLASLPSCVTAVPDTPDQTAVAAAQDNMGATEPYDSQWINHWKEGVDPGTKWDAGKCAPILQKLLTDRQLDVTNKRVLIPGCGRGYDVLCFAQAGATPAVGLDLSSEAVAVAASVRDKELQQHPEAAAHAEFVAGNFFEYVHTSGQQFDIGYDYTFLCALHPDMRKDWARAWAGLIAPGGELITLIFPVGEGWIGNPPWEVSPELYQELLLPQGFEQISLEPVTSELSHKGRAGREWLGRWRRKDTRTAGSAEDGDSIDASLPANTANANASRM